jgi:diguanylate cyclase (GGDEF)-like protein
MPRVGQRNTLSLAFGVRKWQLWAGPRPMQWFVLAVNAAILVICVALVTTAQINGTDLKRFAVLLLLGVLFEEGANRVEHLRARLAATRHDDMTSVWTFAAALVLPPTMVVALVVAIRSHMWFRFQRRNGTVAYRHVFTSATILAACFSAQLVLASTGVALAGRSSGVSVLVGLLVAVAAYTVVNHGLLYGAIRLALGPVNPPGFFSQWQNNALELATLCLASLTGLALLHQPWLTVLVLPSMVVLQRTTLTKELEIAATTDSKTGLLNAVTWHQLAHRELARAQREKQSAALLIIDMDNFKLINDTHGHLVGDAVLKAVAGCLTDELRGYDAVGRFGGEEFVALLADSDAVTAVAVSDRVLAQVRKLSVETRDGGGLVTGMSASIGIACYPDQGTELEDLLHAADGALYRAKSAGRDRVEVHVGAR